MIGFERGPLSTHVVKGRCISNPTPSRRANVRAPTRGRRWPHHLIPKCPKPRFLIVQAAYQHVPEATLERGDERLKRNHVANRTDTVVF